MPRDYDDTFLFGYAFDALTDAGEGHVDFVWDFNKRTTPRSAEFDRAFDAFAEKPLTTTWSKWRYRAHYGWKNFWRAVVARFALGRRT